LLCSEKILSEYYVYILETVAKDGKKSYYTGYTNNLYRRLFMEHRKGRGAKFCRGKKSIKLEYFEMHISRKEAVRRELEIKSFSKLQKKELIKNNQNSP